MFERSKIKDQLVLIITISLADTAARRLQSATASARSAVRPRPVHSRSVIYLSVCEVKKMSSAIALEGRVRFFCGNLENIQRTSMHVECEGYVQLMKQGMDGWGWGGST